MQNNNYSISIRCMIINDILFHLCFTCILSNLMPIIGMKSVQRALAGIVNCLSNESFLKLTSILIEGHNTATLDTVHIAYNSVTYFCYIIIIQCINYSQTQQKDMSVQKQYT